MSCIADLTNWVTSWIAKGWVALKTVEPLVLIVSMVALVYQSSIQSDALSAQQRALAAQTDQSLTVQNNEINKILLDRPELRPYFYDNVPPPVELGEVRSRVELVAEMYLDFINQFDNEYVRSLPGMKPGEENWNQWATYFTRLFEKSPALCRQYQKTKDSYGQKHFAAFISACSAK